MDIEKTTSIVENEQIAEDKIKEELDKAIAEYADKDPKTAEDLKNLSDSRLSLESFNEYMRIRNEQDKFDNMLRNEKQRICKKILAKRHKANKLAKKMRKLNRRK